MWVEEPIGDRTMRCRLVYTIVMWSFFVARPGASLRPFASACFCDGTSPLNRLSFKSVTAGRTRLPLSLSCSALEMGAELGGLTWRFSFFLVRSCTAESAPPEFNALAEERSLRRCRLSRPFVRGWGRSALAIDEASPLRLA